MPWQKFEALYSAHIRRDSVRAITDIRNAQISGLWANTNLDAQKEGETAPRVEIMEKVYENYVDTIKKVYNQYDEKKDDIDWENPFFGRMKVPSNPYFDSLTSPEPHDHNLKPEIDQDRAGDLS